MHVDPKDALRDQLHLAAGNVKVLGELVKSDSEGWEGNTVTHPVRALLDKERDRLIKLAKQAVDLGLDQRRARIAERDAELVVAARAHRLGHHRALPAGYRPEGAPFDGRGRRTELGWSLRSPR